MEIIMKIMKKIAAKAADNMNNSGVTIAFLGDSVTQGCFEVFTKQDGGIETIFDKKSAYHLYLQKIFSILYPTVPVNIINAGISGDNAPHGFERLENDIIKKNPDLTVVCFGLNDSLGGVEKVGQYSTALRNIFLKLQETESEIIFMTPNMMNTKISDHIADENIKNIATDIMDIQNNGTLELYLNEAKKVCEELGVTVCDCYAKWKLLYENGADVTELLSNKINHPTREMNWLFAVSLVETILEK